MNCCLVLMIHTHSKLKDYPIHANFTGFKQRDGLLFPLTAVLNTVKAAEVIFKKRVLWKGKKNIRKEH